MTAALKAGLAILILVSLSSSSWGQEVSQNKHVKFQGKALFKYPNEHPVSIVTFTQQDLEKIRQDRFMRDIKNATFSRKVLNAD